MKFPIWYLIITLLIITTLIIMADIAAAATINVPTDYATIQEAINNATGGDTIVVADGTYSGNINFNGKNVTVSSANGPAACTISGGTNCANFQTGETENAVLDGFTITGAAVSSNGHGIYILGASPTIRNCVITHNRGSTMFLAEYGGGIRAEDGSPRIINCIIKENSEIENNSGGGGMYIKNCTDAEIINCVVANNKCNVGGGGGIRIYGGTVNIRNCTIVNNDQVSGSQGGVYCRGNSVVVIYNSIIWGNKGQVVVDAGSSATLYNCDSQGGWVGPGSNNINSDPVFVNAGTLGLDGYGDYRLQGTSPCIDMGNNLYMTEATDLDGNARIQNGTVDMGAYETLLANDPPIVSVTTPSSPQQSPVTIIYDLVDDNGDNCTVTFDYSIDAGTTWASATAASGDSNPQTSVAPGTHSFQWDAAADLPGPVTYVIVRVTADDGNGGSDSDTTSEFAVDTTVPLVPPSGFSGVGVATDRIEWTWSDDVPGADAYLLQDGGSGTIAMISRPAVLYQETVVGENTQFTRQIRSCTTAATALTVEPPGVVTGASLPWYVDGYHAQYLYTAADLSNQAGTVTKIYWQRLISGAAASYTGVSVIVGHTTLSSLGSIFASNFNVDGSTQVRDPATYDAPVTSTDREWVEIPLDRGFSYDGTNNLVVDIDVASGTDSIGWTKVDTLTGTSLYGNPGSSNGTPWEKKFFLKLEIEATGGTSAPANASAYTLVHGATVDDFSLALGGTGTEVVITVNEPPNAHAGFTGVKIERATNDTFTLNATTIQDFTDNYLYTDTSTSAGNTYWYRITYCNGDGTPSGTSAGESIFVPDPGTNVPPTVAIAAPTSGTHAGDVQITYDLRDVDSDPADISVEYSTDGGGTWNAAGMGAGGDGTTGLATSPVGTSHIYVWDTVTDGVGTSSAQAVQVRITPSDKDGTGTADTTGFTVSNVIQDPPSIVITAPVGGTHSGDVTIAYTLTDANSDTCSVTVEYTTDGGGTWPACTPGAGGDGVSGLDSSPSGTSHTFVWASADDGVGTSAIEPVQVRITPHDGIATGTLDVSNQFNIDNMGIIGPVASFSGSPISGNVPLTVDFTNTSTGTYDAWLWDFGDGGTSTQENPAHTYNLAGTYSVTLTIDGPEGDDTLTRVDYITVTDPGTITAHFSGTPVAGSAPLDVQFTDLSVGTVISWEWDFENDGTVDSVAQNPSHIYNSPGTYTVSLTVTGPAGTDSETRSGYISVTGTSPVANFSGSPATGDAPLAVQFTDTSTGTVTAWSWDFGDGETSTQQNPVHIYNLVGTYTVTLTVDGPQGSDSMLKTDYIIVTDPGTITARFSATSADGNPPLDVQFTDLSVGSITSWLWDFGDGATSTEQNPLHQYADLGRYMVTLTVTGPSDTDTMIITDCICVYEPPPPPPVIESELTGCSCTLDRSPTSRSDLFGYFLPALLIACAYFALRKYTKNTAAGGVEKTVILFH